MAAVNSVAYQRFLRLSQPKTKPPSPCTRALLPPASSPLSSSSGSSQMIASSRAELHRRSRSDQAVVSATAGDVAVIAVQCSDSMDQVVTVKSGNNSQVGGFSFESGGVGEMGGGGGGGAGRGGFSSSPPPPEELGRMVDRAINAAIVLAAGTFAITKLLTIDRDFWHGWTLYEILRYAPQHNWVAYEEALKANPVLAKMMISGVVYSLGDWIAQCYEGKPLFDFDRARMFRSGVVGFTLHGSLSHYYYYFCEALFPFHDWWVVPAKVLFDQTAWAALWNSIYYVVLGLLRFESPANIFSELTATFWPMLTAGWKLWPFAHLITYGVIPVEQRLLWVDCVELVWVTILSTYSNEKSEARNSQVIMSELNSKSSSTDPEDLKK